MRLMMLSACSVGRTVRTRHQRDAVLATSAVYINAMLEWWCIRYL